MTLIQKLTTSILLCFAFVLSWYMCQISRPFLVDQAIALATSQVEHSKKVLAVAPVGIQDTPEMKQTITTPTLQAPPTAKLGIHILHPAELDAAYQLIQSDQRAGAWVYVTVPMTKADLEKKSEWESFFKKAVGYRVIPIVRLATEFKDTSWQIPSKKLIVTQLQFLGQFQWPTAQKHIIIYNEVNHSTEWGGKLDPEGYARVLRFASEWAHTEQKNFVVLPAALDLATPNTRLSLEAFSFWDRAIKEDPELFTLIDAWNSHSYPNPAFSSPPTATGKNSLRGYQHELAYIKKHTQAQLPVYITETGWRNTSLTQKKLSSYYEYAMSKIWSDQQIKAVTPFVLSGDPGPFSEFAFLDRHGRPTVQYAAFQNALKWDMTTQ